LNFELAYSRAVLNALARDGDAQLRVLSIVHLLHYVYSLVSSENRLFVT